jgi:F0F1-type ATP synthase assembly protein I
MVSFTLLGLAIDYFAGTMPWATVVLTPLGLFAAMFHLVRMTKANSAGRS